jgi:hypothetical protein
MDLRSTVLDEIVILDGPGSNRLDACSSCEGSLDTPLYRCLECSYGLLYCGECIVKLHAILPLHRLEVFSCFSLRTITLTMFSVGRMGFSTELVSTHSDTSITLGTMVTPVLPPPLRANSSSSTLTVGTKYGLGFATVERATFHMSTTVSSSACAYTLRRFTVREPLSPLTSSKHITR